MKSFFYFVGIYGRAREGEGEKAFISNTNGEEQLGFGKIYPEEPIKF